MTVWPKQSDTAAMHALFGNPDANGDGAADPSWAAQHLTTIVPPYQLFYGKIAVKKITCNTAIAKPLMASFQGVLDLYKTQAEIARHGMDQFSGCYNFRPKRGGKSLSLHAYGAAIDMDAAHNPFKSQGGTMPHEVVAIFKANGASWGGDWSAKYRDPMHFQWATV